VLVLPALGFEFEGEEGAVAGAALLVWGEALEDCEEVVSVFGVLDDPSNGDSDGSLWLCLNRKTRARKKAATTRALRNVNMARGTTYRQRRPSSSNVSSGFVSSDTIDADVSLLVLICGCVLCCVVL